MSVIEKPEEERRFSLNILMPQGHDRWITAAMMLLVLFGIVMVGSA